MFYASDFQITQSCISYNIILSHLWLQFSLQHFTWRLFLLPLSYHYLIPSAMLVIHMHHLTSIPFPNLLFCGTTLTCIKVYANIHYCIDVNNSWANNLNIYNFPQCIAINKPIQEVTTIITCLWIVISLNQIQFTHISAIS